MERNADLQALVVTDPEKMRRIGLMQGCCLTTCLVICWIPLWVHASSKSYSEEKKEATSSEINVFTALVVMSALCSSMCVGSFCFNLFTDPAKKTADKAIRNGTVGEDSQGFATTSMGLALQMVNIAFIMTILGLLCAWRMLRGGSSSGLTLGVCIGVFGSVTLCYQVFMCRMLRNMGDVTKTSFVLKQRTLGKRIELVKMLEDGTIRLLSCSWLLTSGVHNLMRCQDLPVEAFLTPSQAMLAFQNFKVYVLSYGWLMGGNPDPFGVRVQTVQRFLRSSCADPQCWGIFWDFACLPQNPDRTPYMNKIFGKGLGMMSMLYGSVRTTVLILREILEPPAHEDAGKGYNRTPYDIRGWCIMESTVASFAAFYANNKNLVIEISQDAAPNSPEISLPDLAEAEVRLTTARFTCGKEDEARVMKQLREFNATLQADTVEIGKDSLLGAGLVSAFEDTLNLYISEAIERQPSRFSFANYFAETPTGPSIVRVSPAA